MLAWSQAYVGTFRATLAPYWAHVEPSWAIWVCVGFFFWQALGPYWAYLGPFWAMLGHFGPRWHHSGLSLGYLGVCVGAHIAPSWAILGSVLASVLNFRPCKAFAKNSGNTTKKDNSWAAMLMVFAAIFLVVFVSFLLGHAALRLCLPDLRLILGHCKLYWPILVNL